MFGERKTSYRKNVKVGGGIKRLRRSVLDENQNAKKKISIKQSLGIFFENFSFFLILNEAASYRVYKKILTSRTFLFVNCIVM